jgi:hypothetical protein
MAGARRLPGLAGMSIANSKFPPLALASLRPGRISRPGEAVANLGACVDVVVVFVSVLVLWFCLGGLTE